MQSLRGKIARSVISLVSTSFVLKGTDPEVSSLDVSGHLASHVAPLDAHAAYWKAIRRDAYVVGNRWKVV